MGTIFTLNYKDTTTLNINHNIKVVKDINNAWQARFLLLQDKITVVKSLVIPQIQLLASTLLLDHKTINELDTLLFNFIWNNGRPLIAKNTLIQRIHLGGLKMVWIKRLANPTEAKWKVLSLYFMGITKEQLFRKLRC